MYFEFANQSSRQLDYLCGQSNTLYFMDEIIVRGHDFFSIQFRNLFFGQIRIYKENWNRLSKNKTQI